MFETSRRCRPCFLVVIASLTALTMSAPLASAAPLTGTTITPPGTFVFSGVAIGAEGPLLASLVSPWSFPVPAAGTTSGLLRTAVFRNPGGTLDFYYQVVNDTESSTDIARLSAVDFAGFQTWTGYRVDGGLLAGGVFTNGTVAPSTADRDVTGQVVGFNFGPGPADFLLPGLTSRVMVISTDATLFTIGNASLIDGGTAIVPAFQPAPIPEPGSAVLIICALLALAAWKRRWLARNSGLAGVFAAVLCLYPSAHAAPILGTTLNPPGTTVVPGDVTGAPAGALLASLVAPWSFATTAGTTSGDLTSAVYQNPSGTLDFYYQVANSANSETAISRESDANFAGFSTWTGFRTDGGSLLGGLFVNGSVAPFSTTRATNGIVIGFNFGPVPAARILPGTTSYVLVISTDATLYTLGNASVIDGGAATVASFRPALRPDDEPPVPEPSSLAMIAAGVTVLWAARTLRRNVTQVR